MLSRRRFLNASLALCLPTELRAADGSAPELSWVELELEGDRRLARKALVLSPAGSPPGQTYPGLLLFHGRGETGNESLGIHAWRTRYGLEESYARLRRPPLALDAEERRFIEPAQLDALQRQLREKPFTGMIAICPVTPNPHRAGDPERVLDRYAEWIEHILLPSVRARAPLAATAAIGVDGCSMGGYVAAEVFSRKPHLFRSFGVVQPAFSSARAARYVEPLAGALARGSLRGVHLQTSTLDPYREAVQALGQKLARQGARFTLDVLPGPHDQRWLRATGTLTMLAWHAATLG